MDKKAVNERRLALMVHVIGCDICKGWQDAQFHEAPHWFGSLAAGQPRTEACLRKHRRHLEDVGMIMTEEQVKAMWTTVDGMLASG